MTDTPQIYWLTHIEYDWESPAWAPLLHWLAGCQRLIRYDVRGTGLSDRDVDDISFPAFVRDFEAVVDAAKIERFAVLGISQGASVAIDYAARHPEVQSGQKQAGQTSYVPQSA